MDMEKIKDIVFTIETQTSLIESRLNGIKKLLDMVNINVFQTIYNPTKEDLVKLYYQVNYYSELNELAINNLDILFSDIQEINNLTDKLRKEGNFKPQIEWQKKKARQGTQWVTYLKIKKIYLKKIIIS